MALDAWRRGVTLFPPEALVIISGRIRFDIHLFICVVCASIWGSRENCMIAKMVESIDICMQDALTSRSIYSSEHSMFLHTHIYICVYVYTTQLPYHVEVGLVIYYSSLFNHNSASGTGFLRNLHSVPLKMAKAKYTLNH